VTCFITSFVNKRLRIIKRDKCYVITYFISGRTVISYYLNKIGGNYKINQIKVNNEYFTLKLSRLEILAQNASLEINLDLFSMP